MTTAAPSTALATIQPALTGPERLALAGSLAGYRGLDSRGVRAGPALVHHLVPRPALAARRTGLPLSEDDANEAVTDCDLNVGANGRSARLCAR
jgi:hypothetical protein